MKNKHCLFFKVVIGFLLTLQSYTIAMFGNRVLHYAVHDKSIILPDGTKITYRISHGKSWIESSAEKLTKFPANEVSLFANGKMRLYFYRQNDAQAVIDNLQQMKLTKR